MKHKIIKSIKTLNKVLADGEMHEFIVRLNGGIGSRKSIMLDGDVYLITNHIDDSEQDLTADELFDENITIIGKAIKSGAFVLAH